MATKKTVHTQQKIHDDLVEELLKAISHLFYSPNISKNEYIASINQIRSAFHEILDECYIE